MPKLGLDEQKLDIRPDTPGNAAMDADAQFSFGGVGGKSSEARAKDSRLNLGGLIVCPTIGLSWRQRYETSGEKSAEAVVVGVHRRGSSPAYSRTKGRIRECKEQSGRTRRT
jgi:hypothetical protein